MLKTQDPKKLLQGVKAACSAAAKSPLGNHAFPVGREFALSIGYPEGTLAGLSAAVCTRFAGVSNVSIFAEIPPGSTVLDLGCGSGLDSLIAASKTGPGGKVVGVDFSPEMLDAARTGASEFRVSNLEFHQATAAELPLANPRVDVALFNGTFNLNPDREALFHELARVVRPGGSVFGAALVLREPVSEAERTEADWFA